MHALRIPIAGLTGVCSPRRCSGCSGASSRPRSRPATVPKQLASTFHACAATPKSRRSAMRGSSANGRRKLRSSPASRFGGGIENDVAQLTPVVDARGAMSRMTMSAGSDRDVIPLVRINPDYPPRALDRGLEGWVQVQFTITATGTVKDAIVVNAEPKNIFDDAALKAIARWRYNPKVESGAAVERVGVQTRIVFNVEE